MHPCAALACAMASHPKGEEEDGRFPLAAALAAEVTIAKAFQEVSSDARTSETKVAQLARARACKHCGIAVPFAKIRLAEKMRILVDYKLS